MQMISIMSYASLSAIGHQKQEVWNHYLSGKHGFSLTKKKDLVAKINPKSMGLIEQLKASNRKYKHLDPTVLYAISVSNQAFNQTQWDAKDVIGIGIGSSRGATSSFEKYHKNYLDNKKLSALSSPTTTLGNISSWVAHELGCNGPEMSHSVTCSSGLYSVLNACAWIISGMCEKFVVGGSEAPLTPFTIAQMQALGICANDSSKPFPCQSLNLNKKDNSMILGEGAAVICLQKGQVNGALASINGFGYANEVIHHNTSISSDAKCLQQSMKMALMNKDLSDVDVIITHSPGTMKGDLAEVEAIKAVFHNNIPAMTTNKWKLGHTLASSGLLSIELALLMIENQEFIPVPFIENQKFPKRINTILINAVGFGGNAVSILISKSEYHK